MLVQSGAQLLLLSAALLLGAVVLAQPQGPGPSPPSPPGPGPKGTPPPPPNCKKVRCERPLCANPVTPPGECCPSCENSGCVFEGCVQFPKKPWQEVQWKPEPCKTCVCVNNEPVCGLVACPGPEPCFGYPLVKKPWECCTSCDFGIPDNKCGVVPSRKHPFETSPACSSHVLLHKCDKANFRRNSGKTFRCKPVFKHRRSHLPPCAAPLRKVVYNDVVQCKAVRDDNIRVGCDLILG